MFNITQIQACFAGLVGFKKTLDPTYPAVLPELLSTTSGKLINHPLCSVENLFNVFPDFGEFSQTTQEATALSFNNYLKTIYNNACGTLIANVLESKMNNYEGKSILESQQLYTGFGFVGDKIIKQSRFVGFQINTAVKQNLMVIISSLGFQVDTIQTVKFYLYHTSQVEPINTIDMVISRANSFTWKSDLVNVVMSYMKGNQNTKGNFYLGYYEDDLLGQAIRMDKNLQKAPCSTCSMEDTRFFNMWSKYVGISSISVPLSAINEERNLFDLSAVVTETNTNWGMNLSITTVCDLTEFFCANKLAFNNALAQQITLDLITEIAYTTRINAVADKIKAIAMADLDEKDASSFVNAFYKKSLKALTVNFSGFDSDCLPCRRNAGITYSSL